MADAITLHVEDDSDSWPPVALMGIEAAPCTVAAAFDCYYDAKSLYDLHYLTGLHLPMCSGISWRELTYISAFVFGALDIERRGTVRPVPLPSPPAPPAHPHPPLRLIFPAADKTMNRRYRHFAHVNVNVIAFCGAFVAAALPSAHFMDISICKQPQLSIQHSYRAQTADISAHCWTMRRLRSERADKIVTDPL